MIIFFIHQFKHILFAFGAQKCLTEMVLKLKTHNICFGGEIRKPIYMYNYFLLSGTWEYTMNPLYSDGFSHPY